MWPECKMGILHFPILHFRGRASGLGTRICLVDLFIVSVLNRGLDEPSFSLDLKPELFFRRQA